MTNKRCTKCHVVKSGTEFNKSKKYSQGLHLWCKVCVATSAKRLTERGLKVLKSLAENRGCCQHCLRPYTEEDWHFFEFDHIDPNLKLFKTETESRWVAGHIDDFITRVVQNLQLLCVKCHKIKSIEEMKLGGSVYQKIHGQSQSAEVIEPDLTLFDLPTLN